VLLGSRIAHHLKVLQRERLGGNLAVDDLERGLNRWLDGLCADGQVADPELRARRPLRQARVAVSDVPGRAGWLRADLSVRPHLPGCAAEVVLDLVGRLDREVG
jgi:type VI secretion system protein ImpC